MTAVVLAFRRTFHSLRTRNFRIYLAGLAISSTGIWIQAVASAWLVLRLTGDGFALGLELALTFLPLLLFGVWGGVIADRFDKRRVLIATQSALAVLAVALGALTATGVVELWMVYTISLLTGVVTAVDHPTRQAFVPEMVGRHGVTNAVSLNSAVFTGARIVGPAMAAAIVAAVGLAAAFALNGLSYVAVIVSLWRMRTGELHPAERAAPGERSLRDGLRYVRRTPELRRPLLLMAVVFAFSFNLLVLLPLMAERAFDGDAGTYGVLLSLMGAGSFVGALWFAARVPSGQRPLIAAGVAVGIGGVAAGLAPSLAWEMAMLVPLGLASIAFMIGGNTTLQLMAAPQMRGRVMSLYSIVFLGSTPIGAPLAGWLGQQLGPRAALVIGGVIALAASSVAGWVLHRDGTGDPARQRGEVVPLATPFAEVAESENAVRSRMG